MRLQTFFLINAQIGSLNNPRDLIEFPWEETSNKDVTVPDWNKLDKEYIGIR